MGSLHTQFYGFVDFDGFVAAALGALEEAAPPLLPPVAAALCASNGFAATFERAFNSARSVFSLSSFIEVSLASRSRLRCIAEEISSALQPTLCRAAGIAVS